MIYIWQALDLLNVVFSIVFLLHKPGLLFSLYAITSTNLFFDRDKLFL